MRSARRNQRGHISEFAGAIVLFVSFVLLPAMDIGFIPVRYWMATGATNSLIRDMSHQDKRSGAYELLDNGMWQGILSTYGITVSDTKLTLLACDSTGAREVSVKEGQPLSADWLPSGKYAPCVYSLELDATIQVRPCFGTDLPIPALNAPITFHMNSRSQWENLGCDPTTLEYYVNE